MPVIVAMCLGQLGSLLPHVVMPQQTLNPSRFPSPDVQ
jgi:hypothetical protein